MSDQTILMLVGAVIALLSIFGVWKKVQSNLRAAKEWIDVASAAISTMLTVVSSLADGNFQQEELDAIKEKIEIFKRELDEARKFNLKLLSFRK